MVIPQITTLRVEDFPEQKEWIGKLFLPINQFLLASTSAINGNITLVDNIPCQTQELLFTYNAEGDFPKTFAWKLPDKPVELRVCSALEAGSPIGVIPIWSYANKVVSIASFVKISTSGVSALTAGTQYNIVLRGQP